MSITRTKSGQLLYNGNPVLLQYIRDSRRRKIGVVISTVVNGKVYFSFSKTNVKLGDKFNQSEALTLAFERLFTQITPSYPFRYFVCNGRKIPLNGKVRKNLKSLFFRSRNYFKYMPNNGLTNIEEFSK